MSRRDGPLFVERRKYRRRRMMDAARIVPVAGFVLVMLPMLWARGDGSGIATEALYLFLVWAALILAAALVARALAKGPVAEASPPPQAPAADGPPWASELQTGDDASVENADAEAGNRQRKSGGTGEPGGGAAP